MIEELCKKIYSHEDFQKDYILVSKISSKKNFLDDFSLGEFELDSEKILKLLQCATTFALSKDIQFRKIAYNIAIICRNILDFICLENSDKYKILISLILSRLGNFPAENKFLQENKGIIGEFSLPRTLWFEKQIHKENNTVQIVGQYNIVLTDFQIQLWNSVKSYPISIVNAPTSAGKSFILQNHIVHLLSNMDGKALYIVPTRALIEQVVGDFRKILKNSNIKDEVQVTEVPNCEENGKKVIFVLTQERVQLLLEAGISLDLVVVDEAQNVADNARGIILQSVLETIRNTNVGAKFVFATPYVNNPDVFLSMFGFDNISHNIIPMSESPVSQNLFSVNIDVNNIHSAGISQLNDNGEFIPICNVTPKYELTDERKFLAILALELGKGQNNIVYGSEPSACEEIALLISQALSSKRTDDKIDSELKEFSDYLSEHVHKDYLLVETIKNGVAYHYGNLPSFIRKGIERLCVDGKIKYIVCTSTLLQGINLPAQNIFIMKPTKGRDNNRQAIPLNAPDFWNLAGRAGRLTKDFEGNIFLINLHDWDENPLLSKDKMTTVLPSFKNYVCSQESGLLDFICNREHQSDQKLTQGLENAFMKLLMMREEGILLETLESFGDKLNELHKEKIVEAIEVVAKSVTLPYDVYAKNPNVSVYRQQELFDFLTLEAQVNPGGLIPPHPMHQFSLIKNRYIKLFAAFEKYLLKSSKKSYLYYYWLALDWMRGDSYHDLLKSRIEHSNTKRKRGEANVNTEARGLFDEIESGVRFRYVKFSKCYNDILSFVLKNANREDLVASLPPLHLYLELGASSKTMINLIGMGLSRTAASQIAKKMINASMTSVEIKEWLSKENLNVYNLPHSVLAEIEKIL